MGALPGVRPNSLARVGPQQLEDREISALLLPPPSPRARKGLRDGKTKSEGRKLMKRTKSTVVRVEKLVRPARGVGRTAEQGGGVQTPGASAALTLGESLSLGPVGFGGRSPPSLPPRCSSGRVPEASEGYCCPPARSYFLPCPICSQEEDLLFDYGDASRSFVAGSSPEEVTEGLGMPGLGPSSPLDLVQGESEGFNPGSALYLPPRRRHRYSSTSSPSSEGHWLRAPQKPSTWTPGTWTPGATPRTGSWTARWRFSSRPGAPCRLS